MSYRHSYVGSRRIYNNIIYDVAYDEQSSMAIRRLADTFRLDNKCLWHMRYSLTNRQQVNMVRRQFCQFAGTGSCDKWTKVTASHRVSRAFVNTTSVRQTTRPKHATSLPAIQCRKNRTKIKCLYNRRCGVNTLDMFGRRSLKLWRELVCSLTKTLA